MSSGAFVRLVLLLVVGGSILVWQLRSGGSARPSQAPEASPPQHQELEDEIRRSLAESAGQAERRTQDALEGAK